MWRALAFLLFLLPALVSAQTSSTYSQCQVFNWGSGTFKGATRDDACRAAAAANSTKAFSYAYYVSSNQTCIAYDGGWNGVWGADVTCTDGLSCPSGQSFFTAANKCDSPCPYKSGIGSSDAACVAPVACNGGTVTNNQCVCPSGQQNFNGTCAVPASCPTGQSANSSNQCAPTGPAPAAGSPAGSPAGLNCGTEDAAGNYSGLAGTACDFSAGPRYYNCGGYECSVSAKDFVNGSCGKPAGGGTVTCNFIPVYTGNPATPSQSDAPSPVSGASNAPVPPVGCPAGYTLDPSTGVCVSGAQPPTPSSPTSPGSSGSLGTAACPSGFTRQADGTCAGNPVQQPGSGQSVCPPGYAADGTGRCVSSSKIGADGTAVAGGGSGTGTNGASCGGIGQPKCEVDFGKFTPPADPQPTTTPLDLVGLMTGPLSDFQNYAPMVPAGECPSATWQMFGRTYSFDPGCTLVDTFRAQLETAMGVVWLITAIFIILGA